jgi:hypothetical protein
VREHHDLQPHLVERELLERELGKAGVLVVADAILDVSVPSSKSTSEDHA